MQHASADDRIAQLEAELVRRDQEIAALRAEGAVKEARIAALEKQVAELAERLGQNSRNSHRPASSDTPDERRQRRNREKKEKQKRKRGAQAGHQGTHRELVPEVRSASSSTSSSRPNGDGSKNLRLVVSNPAKRPEPPPPKPAEVPRIVRLLALARGWQAMLDRGEVRTRAELADRARLSSVRVCGILGLLRLHPAILAYIEGLRPGTPDGHLTERWLRPVTRLPHVEQLAAFRFRFSEGASCPKGAAS